MQNYLSVDDSGNIRGHITGFLFVNPSGNVWNKPGFRELIKRQDHDDAKAVVRQIKAMFTPTQAVQKKVPTPESAAGQKTVSTPKAAADHKAVSMSQEAMEQKPVPVGEAATERKAVPAGEAATEQKAVPAGEAVGNQKPSSAEQYARGMELYRAGNYDAAFPLLKKYCRITGFLKLKYPDGQAAMGWMLKNGYGTEINAERAYIHYRIAAQRGNREGMVGMVRLAGVKKYVKWEITIMHTICL